MKFVKKFFISIKAFLKKHKFFMLILLLCIAALVFLFFRGPGKEAEQKTSDSQEYTVSKMTLSSTVTGSSVLEPNAEYSITPLVTGEILSAPFEEGDTVTKGQIMYQINAETMENSLSSSDLSIQKAQNSYRDITNDIADLTVVSTISGRISEVYVKSGELINSGTKLADVVDDSVMKIRIPFNEADITSISKGMEARITLVNNGSQLSGTVTSISSASQVLQGHMRVCYVTIAVNNPGAISEGNSATAMIGDIACNDVGIFEPANTSSILAKASGSIESLLIEKGDQIYEGDTVAIIDSDTIDSQLINADLSLQEAQLSRDKILKQLEDYTITAPIDGTVVLKNKKAGEKIENGGSTSSITGASTNTLAVIYDMSSLCFQLDVDELDVKKIKVGQRVTITADAAEEKTYSGRVENVSISGTVGTNGVTTYPVKVRLQDFDDALLPGMNIEATITVEQVRDVLAVPLNAINRGNTIYVKGEKTEKTDRAPEGYKTITVESGISDGNYVEIKSGLVEGDTIYVPKVLVEEKQIMFPGMPGNGMPGNGMPGNGIPGNRMPSGGLPGNGKSGTNSSNGNMSGGGN